MANNATIVLPPSAPVEETWQYVTDVFISHNGTEYRRRGRQLPRVVQTLKVPVHYMDFAKFSSTINSNLAKKCDFPYWQYAKKITLVEVEHGRIYVDTTFLNPGMGVALVGNCGKSITGRITAVTSTHVQMEGDIPLSGYNILVPMMTGFIMGAPTFTTNGNDYEFTLKILSNQAICIDEEIPPQFNGDDIYTESEFFTSSDKVNGNINSNLVSFDGDIGPAEVRSSWLRPNKAYSFTPMFSGADGANKIRSFLHRRAGKFRSFYMPSREGDLNFVSGGMVNNYVAVELFPNASWQNKSIALLTKSGEWYFRNVVTTMADGNTLYLELDSPIGVHSSEISRAMFLMHCRLNSDQLSMTWGAMHTIAAGYTVTEIVNE